MKNKKTLPIIAVLILFIVYNIVIFSFSGLTGFTKAFWTSYGTAMLFFATLLGVFIFLGQAGMTRRDWFFGIPIIKHTVLYGILTIAYAIVFMIFGNKMHIAIPITILAVTWAIYLVMFLSCLYIKENSDALMETNRTKSTFIKDLRSRIDFIYKNIGDPTIKDSFLKLKETADSSMPYTHSGKDLPEIEKEILEKLTLLESLVNSKENEAAKEVCESLTTLLEKRKTM